MRDYSAPSSWEGRRKATSRPSSDASGAALCRSMPPYAASISQPLDFMGPFPACGAEGRELESCRAHHSFAGIIEHPQCSDWDPIQSVPERNARFSVEDRDADRESLARCVAKLAQTAGSAVAAALSSIPASARPLRSRTRSTSAPSYSRKCWRRTSSSHQLVCLRSSWNTNISTS